MKCTTLSVHAVNIRLVGGNNANEGRVELYSGGEWGTVCDDFWDNNDGIVACRQLGLEFVEVRSQAAFGQGTGPIFLDDLQCDGTELSLFVCPHNGVGSHNCAHSEDAGVVCTTPSECCMHACA